MSPIGDISASWTGATQNLALRTRALQKPKAASDLYGNQQDETPPRQKFRSSSDAVPLHCSGTEEPVPFRYAPRLVSPFVAQLLGQILPDCERPALKAGAAYDVPEPATCLLLDARL
jgi:hypothetical protein